MLIALGGLVCRSLPILAERQTQSVAQEKVGDFHVAKEEPDYNGADFTRPETSFETRFQYRESTGTTSRSDRGMMLLKYNAKIDFSADWKLAFLAQLPLVDKRTETLEPHGASDELGIGDSTFQAALLHAIDPYWAFGFGARLVAPTAQDALGGGKWVVMPGFGLRYSFLGIAPDTYFVPVIRYAMSFAGDPARRNISEPQIAPTLNVGLPDRWFATFYPSNDIRINYGDPISGQTGRLFLPFDMAIGRKVNDSLVVSLEAGVAIIKDYPVYNFKTELKLVAKF